MTSGDAAILASNTIKFSVSLKENPFINAAKRESKRNLKEVLQNLGLSWAYLEHTFSTKQECGW